jgi:hypothetical protein
MYEKGPVAKAAGPFSMCVFYHPFHGNSLAVKGVS